MAVKSSFGHGTKHKGPRRDASSPKAIETAKRHAAWLQKRIEGWSYRRIAAEFGVDDSTVWEAVTKELKAVRREPAAELQAFELQAIERLIEMTIDAVEAGEIERIEQLRKLLADRRKLLGLDAPQRVEASIKAEAVDIEELRALLRPLGWDVVPLAAGSTGDSRE